VSSEKPKTPPVKLTKTQRRRLARKNKKEAVKAEIKQGKALLSGASRTVRLIESGLQKSLSACLLADLSVKVGLMVYLRTFECLPFPIHYVNMYIMHFVTQGNLWVHLSEQVSKLIADLHDPMKAIVYLAFALHAKTGEPKSLSSVWRTLCTAEGFLILQKLLNDDCRSAFIEVCADGALDLVDRLADEPHFYDWLITISYNRCYAKVMSIQDWASVLASLNVTTWLAYSVVRAGSSAKQTVDDALALRKLARGELVHCDRPAHVPTKTDSLIKLKPCQCPACERFEMWVVLRQSTNAERERMAYRAGPSTAKLSSSYTMVVDGKTVLMTPEQVTDEVCRQHKSRFPDDKPMVRPTKPVETPPELPAQQPLAERRWTERLFKSWN